MYLSNADPKELEEIAMSEPAIRKALTAEEIFLKQDKERYLYEMREKALLDQVSAMEGAREEGRAEIVLRMLSRGMSVTEVADLTGLSTADVEHLKHQRPFQ